MRRLPFLQPVMAPAKCHAILQLKYENIGSAPVCLSTYYHFYSKGSTRGSYDECCIRAEFGPAHPYLSTQPEHQTLKRGESWGGGEQEGVICRTIYY